MSASELLDRAGASKLRRSSSLGSDAYDRLKGAILNLELKPGEVFSISELARFLGMSRTPVKEALSRLERDHLVELIPNQGLKVRELSLDEVIHILNVREVMDGLAARLATGRIEPAVLESFEKDFQQFFTDGAAADPDRQADLSRDLHKAIIAAAGNPYLENTWNSLMTSFARVSNHGWHAWKRSRTPAELTLRRCREHLDIVTALLKGDAGWAEQVARRHVANALRDIIAATAYGSERISELRYHNRHDGNAGSTRNVRGARRSRVEGGD